MFSSTIEAPVLLVGAAHVVDVRGPLRRALSNRPLDGIALELDAERAEVVLRGPPTGDRPGGDAPFLLRLWAIVQRRLGAQLGEGAGAEMRAAAEIARERSVPVFLIDDPIRETIGRLLRGLSMRERVSLLLGAIAGLFLPSRIVAGQLDRYTEQRTEVLDEIRTAFPSVARVLLDERNEHMADRLAQLRRQGVGRIVAVVGDAHVPGLAGALRRRGLPVETIGFGELRTTTGP